MNLIGITGLARSGKDTIGDMLQQEMNYRKRAFAYHLKRAFAEAFGLTIEYVMTDENKDLPMPGWPEFTLRQGLQRFGTECMRNVFIDSFWIRRLFMDIDGYPAKSFVITDVRFDNEASAITKRGGFIIEVVRPGAGLSGGTGKHLSEQGIDRDFINYTIYNDGDLQDLRFKLAAAMSVYDSIKKIKER